MQGLFGKQRQQRAQSAPRSPITRIHPWDGRFPVLNLGPLDRLTMNDLFTGIGVLGGAGSGKTSTLALLAIAVMAAQCGIVWMCAKPDEVNLVRRLAKVAGREEDVIVIGRDVDGQITPHRFNPLEYEAGRHGVGTTGLIDYLVHCHEILSRKEGQAARGGSDGDRFWEDQFRRLLRYCIDTAKLAGSPLSVQLLRDIQISGPASRDQLGDDAWAARSECWRHLNEIEARLDQGRVEEVDFDRILHFWTHDYAELDPKPKGTIGVMFASLLDSFYAEEPLRSILTTTSTVTPDDVIDHGKIVVLSLPTSIYGKAGRMAQFCFKYSFQRRMIARDKPDDGSFIRPTALWVDEAHQFAHSYDAEYFAEVRSNRGINVFLEQSIGGYMDALGATSAEQVDRYLQGLTTKLFFQNSSPKTNEFASDVIGKRMITRKTDGWSNHDGSASVSGSVTETELYQVLPGAFSTLRRGGAENNREVDCIITKNGGVFHATGKNFMPMTFVQTDLTR